MKRTSKLWLSSASLAVLFMTGGIASAGERTTGGEYATEGFQPIMLEVTVNGLRTGEPSLLLQSPDGTVYASETVLRSWRMRPWAPAVAVDGDKLYALNAAGLILQLNTATQTLAITAPATRLNPTEITQSAGAVGAMTPSATGGFLNYDLVGQIVNGQSSLSGQFEVGVFTGSGVGLATWLGRWAGGDADFIRLETNWTKDDPERRRSLRIGDSITRGGVAGVPVRFAGVQLARNFDVDPGFITIPLPALGGEAATPSVVDVFVNNTLAGQHHVQPGPFTIRDIPVVTGGGEVELIVSDLLGREVTVQGRYYSARPLLRRGLHDFAYEAGFLRERFGRESFDYGAPMVSMLHRYGITNHLTGEFHVTATPDSQAAGLGASMAIPAVGLFSTSLAISNSRSGVGTKITASLEKRTPKLSYGALAELVSDDYVTVGAERRSLREAVATVQAFAGIPLKFGSVGLSYLWRDMRQGPDQQLLSANVSFRLGEFGTLNLSGRADLTGEASSSVLLTLVVPLGTRTSASFGAEVSQATRYRASLQKSLPAGDGFGFRGAAEVGIIDRFDGKISYQNGFGTYDAELSWVDGGTGLRVTASGGVGVVAGEPFLARKLTGSFASVRVGDYAGVRVYAENQHVATTNRHGRAILPRLRPFERNNLRIEVADLPMDAHIALHQKAVQPFDRSGVAIDFDVQPSNAAIAELRRADRTPVPRGATVRLNERQDETVVSSGGEVYLTGLERENHGIAQWAGGSCSFQLSYSPMKDPQPNLGAIRCQSTAE